MGRMHGAFHGEDVVTVHNVWTIYGLDDGGQASDAPVGTFDRPQDWGHPRWHYDQVRFEAVIDGQRYVNYCHCWTDLQFSDPNEYLQLFAGMIVTISLPGTPEPLCSKRYLAEDDFWQAAWGPMPPIWDAGGNDGEE